MKFVSTALAITLAAFTSAPFAGAAQAQQITGAGATFPAPVYAKWGEAAKAATGIELNYQAIGSGGGQNQIFNRTVDFGASDAPVDAAKLEQNHLLQFPTVMGAAVPIVNLPGVAANKLQLTGELLADIYLGKIVKWNDPRLVEANRDLKLPNAAIAPVYRADGSGTTFVFTSYLSAVSPEWKAQVGAATSVKWVAGNGAKGNDGVAATVKQVRGAIGYVEFAYAKQNKLTTTELRNKAGHFVAPAPASFAAAASAATGRCAELRGEPDRHRRRRCLADPVGHFHSAAERPEGRGPQCERHEVLRLRLQERRDLATSLDYIPLPASVQDAVRSAWRADIEGPDGASVWK